MNHCINNPVLTLREKQVVDCMLKKMSVKKSANYLGISPKTVEFHRTNIFQKFQVKDKNELQKKNENNFS